MSVAPISAVEAARRRYIDWAQYLTVLRSASYQQRVAQIVEARAISLEMATAQAHPRWSAPRWLEVPW